MKIKDSFKIALNIIIHSKVRSWLTIIGIIIGIAAVVSIVAIGQGAERSIQQNLNSLNANILTISPGFSRASGAGAAFRGFGGGDFGPGGGFGGSSQRTPKNLTTSDIIALKTISNIQYVTGIISGSTSNASFLGKTARASIEGVDPAVWKYISTSTLASGRFLTQGDTNVIVVGSRVANSTFPGMEINRQMIINGVTFRIIGILQTSGSSGFGGGGNVDNTILMPIDNAVTVLDNKNKGVFDDIIVKINDISLTTDTISAITTRLMFSHSILQASRQDFSVTSPTAIQANITATISSASLFLTAIAIISLIVGAIGIMNTMFTSVIEKTREIGILKAIGAKDRDILAIFLMNSGIIGLIGGIGGIIVGIFSSGFVASLESGSTGGGIAGRFFSTSFVSWQLVVGVFALSIAVGLVAGAIPAYRASRLEPVDALRYE